jgi:hypothetical protein
MGRTRLPEVRFVQDDETAPKACSEPPSTSAVKSVNNRFMMD